MNVESAGPGTVDFVTNNQPFTLFTSNLTLFAAQALTNSAAALIAIYPNLQIISSSNYFTLVTNVTVTAFFTNSPWAPVGSPPLIGFFTNTTITPMTNFVHTFGNVFTVGSRSNALASVPLATIPPPNGTLVAVSQNVSVTNVASPYLPVGTFASVIVVSPPRIFATNAVVGDFFILPGTNCGVAIQSQLQATLALSTNFTITTTNLAPTNGVPGGTNAPESFTQTVVTIVTNRVFIALAINCPADVPALREGVEKITFIRRDFDSLLGQFFDPITNQYYLNQISNNMVTGQRIQRIVTAPDFLISADNLPPEGDTTGGLTKNAYGRNTTFTPDPGYAAGAAGPGTIGNASFTLNRNTPIFINTGLTSTNNFLLQGSQLPFVVWGSFDGTTNPPFIYPTDLSLSVLEAQVLVQFTPFYLPTGFVGNNFSAQMNTQNSGTYWIGPFTWSLAPNTPGLPPGLTIDPTGVISGIPTQAAVYDIVIRATDSQGHSVDRAFTLDISQ
jgi:hypothetical protein